MKTIKSFAIAAAISMAALSNANAGGFLADTFIRPFSPEAADAADNVNRQLGNPVDHAIAAGANVILPGSGTALEAGWAVQRSGVLNGRGGQTQQVFQQQQAPMGNQCATPAGLFSGPFNPIGMPCTANTPWGVAFGNVIR